MKIELKSTIETKKSKAGKEYYTAGIKVNGKWHNGTFFNTEQCKLFESIDINEDVNNIELYEEKYGEKIYQKFKFISKTEARFKQIEDRLNKLEEQIYR